MKTRLDHIATNLAKLRSIVGHVVLPDDLPSYCVTIDCNDSTPAITFQIGSAPNDAGRDKLLALAGDLFGRDGWKKHKDYNNEYFHWKKSFESIDLELRQAERIPQPLDNVPVRPTEFPIMLEDTAPAPVLSGQPNITPQTNEF